MTSWPMTGVDLKQHLEGISAVADRLFLPAIHNHWHDDPPAPQRGRNPL